MAFNINVSYDGVNSREWYTDLFDKATSLKYMTPLVGVKSSLKIPSISQTSALQVGSCSPSVSGTTTFNEKSITVCDLDIVEDLCKTDLEPTFAGELMTKGANKSEIPQMELDFIIDTIQKVTANDLENLIWNGDTTGGGGTGVNLLCDGLLKKLSADSDVIDQTGTTVTKSNVIAEIEKVMDAAVADTNARLILDQPMEDVVLFVSRNVAMAYKQAQNSLGDNTTVGDKPLNYLGYQMVVAPKLPSNRMVLSTKSNLFFATDLLSDWETLQVIDRQPLGEGPNLRVIGNFKFGVEYKFGKYIVYYS